MEEELDHVHQQPWQFPIYIGHTRRLLPTDNLYQDSSYSHDTGTKTTARATSKDTASHERQERALLRDYRYLTPKHECLQCRALLPTEHLLDLHLAEVHDSYFAAQAARKMHVYACLVESCDRKFSSIEQRKQHLMDFHEFPKGYSLDRIHLRRKKGQIRPLPQYQKGKNSNTSGHANEHKHKQKPGLVKTEVPPSEVTAAGEPMVVDDELVEDLSSRLRMAASLSAVPRSVAFGHRRGGFMPGLVRGRKGAGSGGGRGRGDGAQDSRDNINDDIEMKKD